MLYRHIETPEFQCRFKWQKNSVAFWGQPLRPAPRDVRLFPHRRYGHRVTVCGDKPFYRSRVMRAAATCAMSRRVARSAAKPRSSWPAARHSGCRLPSRSSPSAEAHEMQPATRSLSRIGTAMPCMRIGRGGWKKAKPSRRMRSSADFSAGPGGRPARADAAALVVGTEGDPGAAERAHQHRALAIVARRLERHRASGAGRMADRHAAGAQRREIERPASFAREAAHVRDGGVDQVIDEAHAGQRQHLVGQPQPPRARRARRSPATREMECSRTTVGPGRPVSAASTASVVERRD